MKCGPDGCPIVSYEMLTPAEKIAQRKTKAGELYGRGFTMEQIAKQLGVVKQTISNDLADCPTIGQLKPAKSASNPRGAGRHKGSNKSPTVKARQEKIVTLADAGMKTQEIASEVGIGKRMVDRVLEVENARRDAQPSVTPDMLSMTAQQKFDAAINQYKKKNDAQFEQRVRDEVKRRIDEIVLPHWRKQIEQAQELYKRRKGSMDKNTFNKIRRALHPDSRLSISDKVLAEAFDTFMGLEKYLLNEKDSPTEWGNLPDSLAEWDAMRKKAGAFRKVNHGMKMAARR